MNPNQQQQTQQPQQQQQQQQQQHQQQHHDFLPPPPNPDGESLYAQNPSGDHLLYRSQTQTNGKHQDGNESDHFAQKVLFGQQYKRQLTHHDVQNQRAHTDMSTSHAPIVSQSSWPPFEDIANALASDLDASLSGLGSFIQDHNFGTENANSENAMSTSTRSPKSDSNVSGSDVSGQKRRLNFDNQPETPCSSEIKQEPISAHETSNSSVSSHGKKYSSPSHRDTYDGGQESSGDGSNSTQERSESSPSNSEQALIDIPCHTSSSNDGVAPEMEGSILSIHHGQTVKLDPEQDTSEFQYILGARTAVGFKKGDESMTYLNQSQAYEVRLRKIALYSPATAHVDYRGKMLRSLIRLGFQERRLQYHEIEEIKKWHQMRPHDRMLDVDLSLSYGVFDVKISSEAIHLVEFCWEPMREASIFVRINCISTEFTAKGHGGEKGAPFKLVIETYLNNDPPLKLDVASCQVKVFKSKGADRKHKTDREKVDKMPMDERNKFQSSFECTLFTRECLITDASDLAAMSHILEQQTRKVSISQVPSSTTNRVPSAEGSPIMPPLTGGDTPTHEKSSLPLSSPVRTPRGTSLGSPQEISSVYKPSPSGIVGQYDQPTSSSSSTSSPSHSVRGDLENQPLSAEASASETAQWLMQNRFQKAYEALTNFSSKDLRRLSKDDLVQLCGPSEGIRLYNALHSHHTLPSKTIYITIDDGQTYHPAYLEYLSVNELASRLGEIYSLHPTEISAIYLIGPNGIRIHVTDRSIENLTNEASFMAYITSDPNSHQNAITLKPNQSS